MRSREYVMFLYWLSSRTANEMFKMLHQTSPPKNIPEGIWKRKILEKTDTSAAVHHPLRWVIITIALPNLPIYSLKSLGKWESRLTNIAPRNQQISSMKIMFSWLLTGPRDFYNTPYPSCKGLEVKIDSKSFWVAETRSWLQSERPFATKIRWYKMGLYQFFRKGP